MNIEHLKWAAHWLGEAAKGKKIEVYDGTFWRDVASFDQGICYFLMPMDFKQNRQFRIVEEPKEPTYRPWTMQEVPLNAWYKFGNDIVRLTGIGEYTLGFGFNYTRSLGELCNPDKYVTYTFDNPTSPDAKWLKCGVEEIPLSKRSI